MKRPFTMAGVLMAAATACTLGTMVRAQDTPGSVSAMDKNFAVDAAHGGAAEVKLGELAAKQGSNAHVKEFGQKMVEDHTKANDALKTVATSKGITLPEEPNAEQKATMAHLMKLHGAAFDKAYIKAMKADHKMDIAHFKKEANTGKDPDIKSFAAKTLPVVQGHYQMLMGMKM